MKFEYVPVLAMLVLSALVPGLFLAASAVFAPRCPSVVKQEPFECGNVSSGPAWGRFAVKFYLTAIPLHRLRRRGGLPLPLGAALPPPRHLRLRRDDDLHLRPRVRAGLRLAQGRARVGLSGAPPPSSEGEGVAIRLKAAHVRGSPRATTR